MEDKKQVIREIQISGEIKSSDPSLRKYCLLELSDMHGIGPMINLGTFDAPKWFIYKIIKKFASKEEAEKYSQDKNIEIVNWAMFD